MGNTSKELINGLKDIISLTQEDKNKILDEAVCEVHGANSEFFEAVKMNVGNFRNWYILHTLHKEVDRVADEKIKALGEARAKEFLSVQKKGR